MKKFNLKVQKAGDNSSYTATIPMEFIKANGIVKGDVLEVELVKVLEEVLKEKGEENGNNNEV